MKLIVVGLVAMLSGCSMLQPSADMSAAQINASQNAAVTCSFVVGAWGTAKVVTINRDKNSTQDGTIAVDGERGCTATITSFKPPVVLREPSK